MQSCTVSAGIRHLLVVDLYCVYNSPQQWASEDFSSVPRGGGLEDRACKPSSTIRSLAYKATGNPTMGL